MLQVSFTMSLGQNLQCSSLHRMFVLLHAIRGLKKIRFRNLENEEQRFIYSVSIFLDFSNFPLICLMI